MTQHPLILTNAKARAVFLDRHLLTSAPFGPARGDDLLGVLDHLGFVQVDSINTLARAHDLILWSRRQRYRRAALRHLVDRDRTAFEGWTHDASILPMAQLPHWQHKFARDKARIEARWKTWHRGDFLAQTQAVLDQIAEHGPVSSSDVGKDEKKGTGGWWDWHPSKTALEYLWRTGAIMVTKRDGFRKFYDLTEAVAGPPGLPPDWDVTRDWACRAALQKLGFATPAEIAAFFDLVPLAEAKAWATQALAAGTVTPIMITDASGAPQHSLTLSKGIDDLRAERPQSRRIRILSPFDPALRDRKRALRLFGFDYKIEIFVPEAKRKYGYYVFPVLQGHRLIGRIDVKADRTKDALMVQGYWPEPGCALTKSRRTALMGELNRLLPLAGCSTVQGLQMIG